MVHSTGWVQATTTHSRNCLCPCYYLWLRDGVTASLLNPLPFLVPLALFKALRVTSDVVIVVPSEGLYWSEQIFQKFQSMNTDTSTQLDIIHDNSVLMKMDQMILCPFQAENKNNFKCFQNVTFTLWQNPSGLIYSKGQCAKALCLRNHIPALLGMALSSWIKTSDQCQPSVTLKLLLCNVQRYFELQNTRKTVQFFINTLETGIYCFCRGSTRDDPV